MYTILDVIKQEAINKYPKEIDSGNDPLIELTVSPYIFQLMQRTLAKEQESSVIIKPQPFMEPIEYTEMQIKSIATFWVTKDEDICGYTMKLKTN